MKDDNESPDNPCPFLRALVSAGLLENEVAPISEVTTAILRVAATGDGNPRIKPSVIGAICLIANGISPWKIARNGRYGIHIRELRNGPLYKRGASSRILDMKGSVDNAELARLRVFASEKRDSHGIVELGISALELKRMMDGNFKRARSNRRFIDRRLMDGEWPVLLRIMGKDGKKGRYLSIAELDDLFCHRRLPARMTALLANVAR